MKKGGSLAKNFAEIAFTESVTAQQQKYGSCHSYARMEAMVPAFASHEQQPNIVTGNFQKGTSYETRKRGY